MSDFAVRLGRADQAVGVAVEQGTAVQGGREGLGNGVPSGLGLAGLGCGHCCVPVADGQREAYDIRYPDNFVDLVELLVGTRPVDLEQQLQGQQWLPGAFRRERPREEGGPSESTPLVRLAGWRYGHGEVAPEILIVVSKERDERGHPNPNVQWQGGRILFVGLRGEDVDFGERVVPAAGIEVRLRGRRAQRAYRGEPAHVFGQRDRVAAARTASSVRPALASAPARLPSMSSRRSVVSGSLPRAASARWRVATAPALSPSRWVWTVN